MPNAQSVIGLDTGGSVAVTATCDDCGGKHRLFECPRKFARDNPGKTMPGFDANGTRIPASWNGDNITPATKQQWLRMQGLGFFTLPPERGDPATMPALQ